MDESVKEILKSQLESIKQQRLKEWWTVSEEETKEVEYFLENYEEICYPTKKTKDWEIPLEWERQHKVPKVLLDFFANSEWWLFQYDLKNKKVSDKAIPTSNVLKEEDFYVISEKDWKRSYIFEKFLFRLVLEWNIGNVIRKIQKKESLTPRDWQILSGFVSYQYVRTDSFVNSIKESTEFSIKMQSMHSYDSFEQFASHIELMKRETGKDIWDVRKLYEYMKAGNYDVNVEKQSIMWRILKLGNDFWKNFLNANYEVLETNKSNFFIISDNPFFIIPPKWRKKGEWIWLMYPINAERIIPISSKQCLRISLDPRWNWWVWVSYKTINNKETNRINHYICKNATRFILSKNREYLSQLVEEIDFAKCNWEKNYNKLVYDEWFKMQIGKQLYPL